MKLIENLNWRYATKTFDPDKKVKDRDIEWLKEAIRLSVSSYGLQLYKVLIIQNQEIRTELCKASWDQKQVVDASHLFVFCNFTRNYDQHVDEYIERMARAQKVSTGTLTTFSNSIKSSIHMMSAVERKSWAEKQTYLALSNLLIACAELRIDACPMEGFDKHAYNQILGLDELGWNASVIAPVGYRSAKDITQSRKKVRKSTAELFETA